jgi:regulator of protease activity HflC (stomatin/prohibitin superfamily)
MARPSSSRKPREDIEALLRARLELLQNRHAASAAPSQRQEVRMLPKVILVLVAAFVAYLFEPTRNFAIPLAVIALIAVYVLEAVRVVPQQSAFVIERLGKFDRVLEPGLRIIFPPFERVAYRHSLKEVPLDVAEQVCITRDNTQLGVDGIIYYQVTDPYKASYGTSDPIMAITQLAQTTLRSEIGKMELDKTLESRDEINRSIVSVLDEAGSTWGVKVLRYEVKNLTPPESILRAMQQQITAEREKRALIAKSEGQKQEEINLAEGEKQSDILKSEGEKTAAINKAQGDATAIRLIAEATASAVQAVAAAMNQPGGDRAANLKIAEQYVAAFGNLARTNNTLIVPANVSDVAGLLATAMTVLDRTRPSATVEAAPAAPRPQG